MFRTISKSCAVENSFDTPGVSETYTQVVFEPMLIALDIVVAGTIHVVGTQALAETIIHANTGFALMFLGPLQSKVPTYGAFHARYTQSW